LLDMSMLRREHAQGEKSAQRFDFQSEISSGSAAPGLFARQEEKDT